MLPRFSAFAVLCHILLVESLYGNSETGFLFARLLLLSFPREKRRLSFPRERRLRQFHREGTQSWLRWPGARSAISTFPSPRRASSASEPAGCVQRA